MTRSLDEVVEALALNEREGYTIKEAGGWLVEVLPMIYNHRIALTPACHDALYLHAWCYQGQGYLGLLAAITAANLFDPLVDYEPAGYFKRATPDPRRPGPCDLCGGTIHP